MEKLTEFLAVYPKIGATLIATTFASTGWVFRNLFELYIEKRKYKRELKTYFWKEKINASKKASEFYFEYANFLNLARIQFENYRLQKIEHSLLIKNFQKEVQFYADKLKSFPHFEHHHINIFYEFDENKSLEINNEINSVNREILELNPEEDNSENAKYLFEKIENNYQKLFNLQKGHTNKVRKDLKEFM